jgi:hypothetical protein
MCHAKLFGRFNGKKYCTQTVLFLLADKFIVEKHQQVLVFVSHRRGFLVAAHSFVAGAAAILSALAGTGIIISAAAGNDQHSCH